MGDYILAHADDFIKRQRRRRQEDRYRRRGSTGLAAAYYLRQAGRRRLFDAMEERAAVSCTRYRLSVCRGLVRAVVKALERPASSSGLRPRRRGHYAEGRERL
ncbi:MAG: hypothetical protein ACLUEQ_06750 [Cloacibacillus evryensis]